MEAKNGGTAGGPSVTTPVVACACALEISSYCHFKYYDEAVAYITLRQRKFLRCLRVAKGR